MALILALQMNFICHSHLGSHAIGGYSSPSSSSSTPSSSSPSISLGSFVTLSALSVLVRLRATDEDAIVAENSGHCIYSIGLMCY